MKPIKVIMASHLKPYQNSASNQPEKFIRAVNSFISQTYENKELIIVSDGCEITVEIYNDLFKQYHSNIKLIELPKQELFSGKVRQTGIDSLNNENCIICYLDADDEIKPYHISKIVEQFADDLEFVYYDDYIAFPMHQTRNVELKMCSIGTSTIAHINKPEFRWDLVTGYGHDWRFIESCLMKSNKYKKIFDTGYLVHHIPNILDN